MIHDEGFDAVCDRHKTMAEIVEREAAALGLGQQCPGLRNRSTTVTALALPAPLAPDTLREGLKRRGILTAAALEHYQPTAFRIGHMGDIRPDDVEKTMAAVREIIFDGRGSDAPGPRAMTLYARILIGVVAGAAAGALARYIPALATWLRRWNLSGRSSSG
jgi:aspartate aminotransferase-like enzyme